MLIKTDHHFNQKELTITIVILFQLTLRGVPLLLLQFELKPTICNCRTASNVKL